MKSLKARLYKAVLVAVGLMVFAVGCPKADGPYLYFEANSVTDADSAYGGDAGDHDRVIATDIWASLPGEASKIAYFSLHRVDAAAKACTLTVFNQAITDTIIITLGSGFTSWEFPIIADSVWVDVGDTSGGTNDWSYVATVRQFAPWDYFQ